MLFREGQGDMLLFGGGYGDMMFAFGEMMGTCCYLGAPLKIWGVNQST